jgi:hypothetical protein
MRVCVQIDHHYYYLLKEKEAHTKKLINFLVSAQWNRRRIIAKKSLRKNKLKRKERKKIVQFYFKHKCIFFILNKFKEFCRKINRIFHVWSMISSKYLCVHELNVIWRGRRRNIIKREKRIKNTNVQNTKKVIFFKKN